MPGISLISDSGNLLENNEVIVNTLNSLNVLVDYTSTIHLFKENLFLGWNKYENYPIKNFKIGSYDILIEGKIYNKKDNILKNELEEIINIFGSDDIESKLRMWLITTDGDFIIYFIDTNSNRIYLINDIFGRLPLYYYCNNNKVIVSRYLKFITEISSNEEYDKLAIALILLIGYPLGERTIFKNIQHLRPASFVKIENSKLEIKTLHQFNFELRENRNKSLKQNVAELSRLFTNSCNNQYEENLDNIVALSGGIDSRLVASCMYKSKLHFDVVTMDYANGHGKEEIGVAEELCKIFNVKIKLIKTTVPKGSDVFSLLKIKEGMVTLFSTPVLPFYEGMKNEFGKNIHYISGDNGDKVIFTYDKPIRKTRSVEELTEYFIDEYSLMNIDTVCELTGLKKADMLDEFVIIFNGFPEISLTQKYIHLKAIEKPFQYAFQNEDRHRHYFWNTSPFWSYPFYNYIMGIPEKTKKMHRLFRKLLQSYSKEATNIPYTNFKSSINSVKGRILMAIIFYSYSFIPFKYMKKIKSIFFGGNPNIGPDHIVKKCINEQIEKTKGIKEYINLKNDDPVLKKISLYNLYNFFTILSTIELSVNRKSIIEQYPNSKFPSS